MKALVTGASSGIGRDMSKYLSSLGYDLVIVARRRELLEELKSELSTNVEIVCLDVSQKENCIKLFEEHKDVDLVINNAGFGLYGEFSTLDLDKELSMINTNIEGVHVLTKLYVKEMDERGSGKILNVSSVAGFMPGPLMATYYATKNYVTALSRAVNKELKKKKSNVRVSILCPGPVNTNFNNVAGVRFGLKGLDSSYVAKYAIDKTLEGKEVIVPGFLIKCVRFFSKIIPDSLLMSCCYESQKSKNK